MVRTPAAVVGVALATAAPAQLDHYGGGGVSRSPDGRWRVWSRAPDADEAEATTAWLTGPGVKRRPLLSYERLGDVTWLADQQPMLVVTSTAHFQTLATFPLAPRDRIAPGLTTGASRRR